MHTDPTGRPGDLSDPDGWRHGEVSVDGVRLHYVDAGPDRGVDAPLVVALHGFPGFWYDWRRQLDALAAEGFRVVAPDLRGYNRSDKPRGVEHYRIRRLVEDLVGLVDAFGRSSAHVVGHDWGGIVAWETAIRRPGVLDRVAICNAPHPEAYRRELRTVDQLSRSAYALFFQVPRAPERVLRWREFEAIERLLTGSSVGEVFDEADLRRYRNAIARRRALPCALNYYRAAGRTALRREARRIASRGERVATDVDVPTLVLWGERDPALSPSLVEGLEEWVNDLRVETFPAVGHWVQLEAASQVNDLLSAFLAAERSRADAGEQAAR